MTSEVKRNAIKVYLIADLVECCADFLEDPSLGKIKRVARKYKKLAKS